MAKVQITTPADKVVVSLFMDNQNPIPMGSLGVLQALLSPDNRQLMEELSPLCKTGSGKFSKDPGGFASVRVNYAPMIENLVVNTVLQCNGISSAPPFELPFNLLSHRNYGLKFTSQEIEGLKCDAEAFLEAEYSNILGSIGDVSTDSFQMMGYVKMQIYRTIDNLARSVNTDATTKLALAAGVNPIYNSAAVQGLQLHQTVAPYTIYPKALTEFMNLKRKARIKGKLIVIGGGRWAEYFDYLSISAPNTAVGHDLPGKYASKLSEQISFYYDEYIDTTLGLNQCLVLAPNMSALVAWPRYEYMKGITNGSKEVANVSYRTAFIPEFEQGVRGQDNFLPIDIMVKEDVCNPADGNLPTWSVIPQINYEVFTTPTSTRFTAGALQNVNGIFRYQAV